MNLGLPHLTFTGLYAYISLMHVNFANGEPVQYRLGLCLHGFPPQLHDPLRTCRYIYIIIRVELHVRTGRILHRKIYLISLGQHASVMPRPRASTSGPQPRALGTGEQVLFYLQTY